MSKPALTRQQIDDSVTEFFKTQTTWERVAFTVDNIDKEPSGVIYKSTLTGQAVGVVVNYNPLTWQTSLIHMLTILHGKRFGLCVAAQFPEYLSCLLKKTEAFTMEEPVMPGDLQRLIDELT